MKEDLLEKEDIGTIDHENCHIVVFNDDHNPIDVVVQIFIDVLKHSSEQAEQLTLIIHHKGQARVKGGTFEELQPICEKLIDKGLDSTIE